MRHLFIACLLLLAGCSIVSKDQCRNLNWYCRGYADAMRGMPYADGARYASACRDQGVYLDIAPWQRGYQRHLNQTGSDLEELIGPRSRAITRKLESVQQLDPDTATALLGIEE